MFVGRLLAEFAKELKRLNRELLTRYQQVLSSLTEDPSAVEARVSALSHTLFNVTHLLNLLRPHQARQALMAVLQRQVEARNQKAEYLEK